MARQPSEPAPRLEALLDERDHVRIQISLLADESSPDVETLNALRAKLRELERKIQEHSRNPDT